MAKGPELAKSMGHNVLALNLPRMARSVFSLSIKRLHLSQLQTGPELNVLQQHCGLVLRLLHCLQHLPALADEQITQFQDGNTRSCNNFRVKSARVLHLAAIRSAPPAFNLSFSWVWVSLAFARRRFLHVYCIPKVLKVHQTWHANHLVVLQDGPQLLELCSMQLLDHNSRSISALLSIGSSLGDYHCCEWVLTRSKCRHLGETEACSQIALQ
eukprot:576946-Amphidinium_carterae.1